MSGSLRLTTSETRGGDTVVEETPSSASKLWTEVVYNGLGPIVVESLAETLADVEDIGEARVRLEELLGGALADGLTSTGEDVPVYAENALKVWKHGDDDDARHFITLTAQLGRGHGTDVTPYVQTVLEDVSEGPLALLEAAGSSPTIVLHVDAEWFDAPRETRQRCLGFILDLSETCDVVMKCSRLALRRLRSEHTDDLPASVRRAQALDNNTSPPANSSAAADADGGATEAVSNKRVWDMLSTLRETNNETRAKQAIHTDTRFSDVSRSAREKWMSEAVNAGLADVVRADGRTYFSLLPAGDAALEALEGDATTAEADTRGLCGSNSTHQPDTKQSQDSDHSDSVDADVSNPPSSTEGPYSPTRAREAPPGDSSSAAEAEAAADTTADEAARRAAGSSRTEWLPWSHFHAAGAIAVDGADVALDSVTLDENDGHRGSRRVGYDTTRKEVVVEFTWSPTAALSGVRRAAALASDRLLNGVLDVATLSGDGPRNEFEGLAVDNRHVLSRGAGVGHIGYDTTPSELRQSLREARMDVLRRAAALQAGEFDPAEAKALLEDAHGLATSVLTLLDLAGYDVTQVVRAPDGDERQAAPLAKFIGRATTHAARYGVYRQFKTQFEQDEENREYSLGAPDVDDIDPRGNTVGSWVVRGPGVEDDLAALLDGDADRLCEVFDLEAQREADGFAEFLVDLDVRTATRRETVAGVVARLGGVKSLESTRLAVSLFHALTASAFDVAEAMWSLGSEERRRELHPDEVRLALSALEPRQLLPDVGTRGLSVMVSDLLKADEALPTSAFSVSSETVRKHRAELEAAGLLEVEETGAGKATLHRFRLPFSSERGSAEAPLPRFADLEADMAFKGEWYLNDVLELFLETLGESMVLDYPDVWGDLVDGTIDVVTAASKAEWIELSQWVDVLVQLTGVGDPDRSPTGREPPEPWSASSSVGVAPPGRQLSLSEGSSPSGVRADGGSTDVSNPPNGCEQPPKEGE